MTFRRAARTVFLTGGTGFVGRRVLSALDASDDGCTVRCLTRRRQPEGDASGKIQFVLGDLTEPDTYRAALPGCDVVLHLAATTGKAKPATYFQVNAEGTRRLLQASKESGVSRFVYVSSIAAVYRNSRAYHYGHSKAQAEEAVRASGINHLIVRPTVIIGRDSAVWKGLVSLASLPLTPVFGDGQVLVQPVDVDDIVRFLTTLAADDKLPNRAVDLGGPDVLTLESLLQTIRGALGKPDRRMIHLPVRSVISFLVHAEKWLLPVLPFTAGQLSLFVNDSIARPDPLVIERLGAVSSVQESLQRLVAHG